MSLKAITFTTVSEDPAQCHMHVFGFFFSFRLKIMCVMPKEIRLWAKFIRQVIIWELSVNTA